MDMLSGKLIEYLFKNIEEGNVAFVIITIGFTIVSTIAFAIAINIKSFSEFIENFRLRKIKIICEALESSVTTGKEKKLYEHELKKEYFHKVTGLLLNNQLREKVLEIYNNHNDELSFRDIKRAVRYMSFPDGKFKFKITLGGHIEQFFNRITAFCTFIFGMSFMLIPLLPKTTISQFIASYFIDFAFLSITMILITQCFNVTSSKLVEKAINKQNATE